MDCYQRPFVNRIEVNVTKGMKQGQKIVFEGEGDQAVRFPADPFLKMT